MTETDQQLNASLCKAACWHGFSFPAGSGGQQRSHGGCCTETHGKWRCRYLFCSYIPSLSKLWPPRWVDSGATRSEEKERDGRGGDERTKNAHSTRWCFFRCLHDAIRRTFPSTLRVQSLTLAPPSFLLLRPSSLQFLSSSTRSPFPSLSSSWSCLTPSCPAVILSSSRSATSFPIALPPLALRPHFVVPMRSEAEAARRWNMWQRRESRHTSLNLPLPTFFFM